MQKKKNNNNTKQKQKNIYFLLSSLTQSIHICFSNSGTCTSDHTLMAWLMAEWCSEPAVLHCPYLGCVHCAKEATELKKPHWLSTHNNNAVFSLDECTYSLYIHALAYTSVHQSSPERISSKQTELFNSQKVVLIVCLELK